MKSIPIVVAVLIGLVTVYALNVFVSADLFWVDGMFSTWTRADRFGFLYAMFCGGLLGWVFLNRLPKWMSK